MSEISIECNNRFNNVENEMSLIKKDIKGNGVKGLIGRVEDNEEKIKTLATKTDLEEMSDKIIGFIKKNFVRRTEDDNLKFKNRKMLFEFVKGVLVAGLSLASAIGGALIAANALKP